MLRATGGELGNHATTFVLRDAAAATRESRPPRVRSGSPHPVATPRHAALLGIGAGLATAAAYLIGSGRALDYDGSVTVANFVRTPSLLDPFRRQVVFNNHPAFSFIEHIVYSVTGSTNGWVLRLVPIGAAAACVGLLVAVGAVSLKPRYSSLMFGARNAVEYVPRTVRSGIGV